MKKRVNKVHNPNPRALTHEVLCAIRDHIKSGRPLVSRDSKYLLLDSHKILKNTYLSWLKRGAVPVDAPHGMSLDEAVAKARQRFSFNSYKSLIKTADLAEVRKVFDLDMKTKIKYRTQVSANSVTETLIEECINPKVVNLKRLASCRILSAAFD